MKKNIINNFVTGIKDLLVYEPPSQTKAFILPETPQEKKKIDGDFPPIPLAERSRELEFILNYAKMAAILLEKLIKDLRSNQNLEVLKKDKAEIEKLETEWQEIKTNTIKNHSIDGMYNNAVISASLEENQQILESLYQLPLNKDVVIRNITISDQPQIKVMLVFMDGMIDKKIINMTILEPLMFMKKIQEKMQSEDLIGVVMEQCLPSGQASRVRGFKEVQQAINTGDAVLFFDGNPEAVTVETKGYEHRGIDRPATEQ